MSQEWEDSPDAAWMLEQMERDAHEQELEGIRVKSIADRLRQMAVVPGELSGPVVRSTLIDAATCVEELWSLVQKGAKQ